MLSQVCVCSVAQGVPQSLVPHPSRGVGAGYPSLWFQVLCQRARETSATVFGPRSLPGGRGYPKPGQGNPPPPKARQGHRYPIPPPPSWTRTGVHPPPPEQCMPWTGYGAGGTPLVFSGRGTSLLKVKFQSVYKSTCD